MWEVNCFEGNLFWCFFCFIILVVVGLKNNKLVMFVLNIMVIGVNVDYVFVLVRRLKNLVLDLIEVFVILLFGKVRVRIIGSVV